MMLYIFEAVMLRVLVLRQVFVVHANRKALEL